MTENEKRMRRVCFTGHRPEKLTRSENTIKRELEKQIRQAMADGLNVFISGMATIHQEQIYQLRKNQVLSYQVPQTPGSGPDRTGCESGKAIGH